MSNFHHSASRRKRGLFHAQLGAIILTVESSFSMTELPAHMTQPLVVHPEGVSLREENPTKFCRNEAG